MPAYLVSLTGPLAGRSLEIPEKGLTLGRHPSNSLAISEPTISRFHSRLERNADGFTVTDLDSRHGTFLNGRPVRSATLRHGDLLVIGDSTFLAALENEAEPLTAPFEAAADLEALPGTEIRLPAGDPFERHTERLRQQSGDGQRALAALAALLDLAAAVSAGEVRDAASLGAALLPRLFPALPAERAALLPLEGGADFTAVYWRAGLGREAAPFAVSRTLLARLARDREAVVYNALSGGAVPAESVEAAGVRSLAAVPLVAFGRPVAALYLDRLATGPVFSADHLSFLAAAAALAAGALAQALHAERLADENRRLRDGQLGHGLVGESPPMRRVAELLARAAPAASTVLVLGESGTGKELAARALHAASPRAARPFVAINCATLSETLLESELFGHEKGAFTGAVARKIGKLEVAEGGTLFLDEVGELPAGLQARLLRVLQERKFERVGGTQPIAADIRLVAATNRDLARAMTEGRFRADLFYRLNVITVEMPPLRERREDIALLAHHFAALHGRAVRGRSMGIAPGALALLLAHDWPGNVRELSNALERAVVLGAGEGVEVADLPESVLESSPAKAAGPDPLAYHEALNRTKRQLIHEALDACGGNVTRAGERLGLHPNHLHRLITSLGMRE